MSPVQYPRQPSRITSPSLLGASALATCIFAGLLALATPSPTLGQEASRSESDGASGPGPRAGLGVEAANETEILMLSGSGFHDAQLWDFRCEGGRACQGIGEDFQAETAAAQTGSAEAPSPPWQTIAVPSQWEQQGFGDYNYGHDEDKSPEVGQYRTRFRAPAAWQGRRVELVFDGVMTDTEAWVDGHSVGPAHRGGLYRFRYDISSWLRPGEEQELRVTVHEASDDRSVEAAERDADYWVFGGIFRPVWLRALPADSIDRVAINADHQGAFEAEVHLQGLEGNLARGTSLRLTLEDLEGRALASPTTLELPDASLLANLQAQFHDILPWSAETPFLYIAHFELLRNGAVAHRLRQRFGFRTVELRHEPEPGLFVNGRRTYLRGINRHAFWPESGRTLTPNLDRADVAHIRHLGLNAVRMSHYPPDPTFLAACDELGLYVIDELAGWHDAYSTRAGSPLVREMVGRDVNHPSILFWSNGNEGGWNSALDSLFHELDPQRRPVLHPKSLQVGQDQGAGNAWDLDSMHYLDWQELEARVDEGSWLNRWRRLRHGRLPLILPTELLHGLYDGGSGAGLAEYWEKIRGSQRGVGLFLWAFTDEAIRRTDLSPTATGATGGGPLDRRTLDYGALDTDGNHAPDGVLGPYREPGGSVDAIRQVLGPIELRAGTEDPAWAGELEVHSRFDHRDLSDLRLFWWLEPSPGPAVAKVDVLQASSSGELIWESDPADKAAAVGRLRADLPADFRRYGILGVRVIDARPMPAAHTVGWQPEGRDLSTDPQLGPDPRDLGTYRFPLHSRRDEALRLAFGTREAADRGPITPADLRFEAMPSGKSGDDPEGDDPEGDDPEGDDPEGDDPEGDEPRLRILTSGHAGHEDGTGELGSQARGLEIGSDGSRPTLLSASGRLELPTPRLSGSLSAPRAKASRRTSSPPDPVTGATALGIELAFDGPLRRLHWQVFGSGWIRLSWLAEEGRADVPGIVFPLLEDRVDNLRFVGRGPARVWGNRPQGSWGVYEKQRRAAPATRWAHEPQWRGYYRARRAVLHLSDAILGLAFEDEATHLGLFAPQFPDDSKDALAKVHQPDGLAFVARVPAIGTKFHPPEDLGWESPEPRSDRLFRGAVWLWAGDPWSGDSGTVPADNVPADDVPADDAPVDDTPVDDTETSSP